MRKTTLLILALFVSSTYAFDIRGMVDGLSSSGLVKTIDPDRSIFGVALGTSEDDFIGKYGKPTGYLVINATDSGMIYGKSHFFFFENKKLTGVRISHNVVDWKISQEILANTPFDRVRWRLSNGIREGMNKADVREILGNKLKQDDRGYQSYYMTEKSTVELDFSHRVDSGEDDSAYHLYGITVRMK